MMLKGERCAVFSCLAFFESAANPWLLPIQRSPGQNGSIFCISVIVIYSTSPVLANDPQFLHFFFYFCILIYATRVTGRSLLSYIWAADAGKAVSDNGTLLCGKKREGIL